MTRHDPPTIPHFAGNGVAEARAIQVRTTSRAKLGTLLAAVAEVAALEALRLSFAREDQAMIGDRRAMRSRRATDRNRVSPDVAELAIIQARDLRAENKRLRQALTGTLFLFEPHAASESDREQVAFVCAALKDKP